MRRRILILWLCLVASADAADFLPSPGVRLQDEGTAQGAVTTLNCSGSGISCSRSGATGTLSVSGGAGASWSTTEIDFGLRATYATQATVTDAAVSGTSKIIAVQSGGAATGRQADENEMDHLACVATPQTGSFLLNCASERTVTHGAFPIHYTVY